MDAPHKVHRGPTSGPSAEKKKSKQHPREKHKGSNPKAFAPRSSRRAERQARRATDKGEKRLHVPLVDRTPDEAPPVIVAVVGPPGTGKTTLIKSLIRRYTKHTLATITGPITVVSGKHRRLTFVECPNHLPAMLDLAKTADLILLMIDASFGFEMETMEFLNMLAPHGMPRIFGVLSHLDLIKRQNLVRATKKRLKQRFWTEIYDGAKLFYLSGVANGRYPDREILNLSRFISVLRFRPLQFRQSHPYILADRFHDLTPPDMVDGNPLTDRKISLYGYLRGTNLQAQSPRVHIPGIGDFTISQITVLPDPCPSPAAVQLLKEEEMGNGDQKVKLRRRTLGDKQKLLYGPMSDVGGVLFDKDAVFVDMPDKTSFSVHGDGIGEDDKVFGMGERLVMKLQDARRGLGEGREMGVRLFEGGDVVAATEVDSGRKERREAHVVDQFDDDVNIARAEEGEDDESDAADIEDAFDSEEEDRQHKGRDRLLLEGKSDETQLDGDFVFADSDSDMGETNSYGDQDALADDRDEEFDDDIGSESAEEEDEEIIGASLQWKNNLSDKALALFQSSSRKIDLNHLAYGEESLENVGKILRATISGTQSSSTGFEDEDENEDTFFRKKKEVGIEMIEGSMMRYGEGKLGYWNGENTASLKDRFVTGNINTDPEGDYSEAGRENEDQNLYGDFEDLEHENSVQDSEQKSRQAEEKKPLDMETERASNARRKEELRLRFEEAEDWNVDKLGSNNSDEEKQTWGDRQKAKIQKQLEVNKHEFESLGPALRAKVEGILPGSYVRLVIEGIPCEFVENFDGQEPIVVGGLVGGEERFGYVQVRIKRHRWHKRILKTNDPLIFSIGWRRFQSIPIYSTSDSRTRNRMLKYTPEHAHCFATFYGPLTASNIGFCALQSVSTANNTSPGFRIAATGVVLDSDQSTEIVKKLKLTGIPYKIFKNTAFVKDMFSTPVEASKFEGVHVRTVSGIRGQIKKALTKPEGAVRVTFEDKILMSDIVFLRAWYPIRPRRYYNPVTSLLEEDKAGWKGMRLTGIVRRELGLSVPSNADSVYRKIERPTRHFNPLRIPKSLQASLPFASKQRIMQRQNAKPYVEKRKVILGGEEKRARELLQKAMTLRNEKVKKRKEAKDRQRMEYKKKIEDSDAKRREREKREKKEFWAEEGRKRKSIGDGSSDGPRGAKSMKRR